MVDSLSLKRSWQRDRVVVVPAFFLSFLVHGIDSGARWSLWRRVAGFDSSFFAIFYAKLFGFGPRLWVWMRSRCLIDWCSPNRGCVVADEAQNVQYSRWRCVSSVFMRIREEYVWCVIGVVVRRTISRIARWSSPLGDDSDLGKPLCVCVEWGWMRSRIWSIEALHRCMPWNWRACDRDSISGRFPATNLSRWRWWRLSQHVLSSSYG